MATVQSGMSSTLQPTHRYVLFSIILPHHLMPYSFCSTGKEMDFLQLFETMGLSMAEMATSLGMDKTTLSRMDRNSLLQLLTQR